MGLWERVQSEDDIVALVQGPVSDFAGFVDGEGDGAGVGAVQTESAEGIERVEVGSVFEDDGGEGEGEDEDEDEDSNYNFADYFHANGEDKDEGPKL